MAAVTMATPVLPPELRSIPVTRAMFITAQHYAAWLSGTPLRRHIPGRKKIDRELRELVYRGKGRQCERCGKKDYLTVDHIVPVALGGSTTPANARVLCQSDNRDAFSAFARYLRSLDRYLKAVA